MTRETDNLREQALAAYREKRLAEAARLFEAARAAEPDPATAAELANNLSVAYLQAGRAQEALAAVRGTPELFRERGDRRREAQANGNLAAALEATGDLAGAERAYREAADLFGPLGDADSLRFTLNALAQVQLRLQRPLEAAATLQAVSQAASGRGLRGRLLKQLLRLPSRLLRL